MRTGPHGETTFDDGDTFTVRMTDLPINHDFVNLPDNWTYDSEHDLGVVPSLMAHQARAALLAAREVSGR